MQQKIKQSGRNDSSVLDRQGKDCPDVIEKTVLKIPKKYRDDIKGLQERYNLRVGPMINISLKELGKICESVLVPATLIDAPITGSPSQN